MSLIATLRAVRGEKIHIQKDRTLTEDHIDRLLTDVIEQLIQRPKNQQACKRYYSGKKKRHTQKMELTMTPEGTIID